MMRRIRVATYLPASRIHEVYLYFAKNLRAFAEIAPVEDIVYVDCAAPEGEDLVREVLDGFEVRFDRSCSRGGTWFKILRDFADSGDDAWLVIDSDNLVNDAKRILKMIAFKPFFGVLDDTATTNGEIPPQFMKRTADVRGDVAFYRVFAPGIRGNPIFFGPKQVVGITDAEAVDKYWGKIAEIADAFNDVDTWLRNFISDETVLGFVSLAMGVEETPYLVGGTTHMHHFSPASRLPKHLIAKAHFQFAKALARRRIMPRYVKWYLARFTLSYMANLF